MLKEIALSWIDENEKRIIGISDRAWEYAEVGLQEYKTSQLLSSELERHGFRVERGVADMPTAFVATYGSGRPVIGILGELDALPGLSQKPVPYREPLVEGAPGHGCGHNIHGTSGMAGAIAVKVALEEAGIPGTVRFYGCPAEETLVGKVWLVRDGYFEGVDAVLSHHPGQANTAGLASSNAMNSVKFHFYGVSSHAAGSPEQGRSALDAVELMDMGINYMREHIIQEARIHYVIEEGGHEPNVVPAYARSWFYVRAPEREQVEEIYRWVLEIAEGADRMARTTHKVEFLTGCYNLIPNRVLSELVVSNMREIGAPKHTEEELEFARELNKSIPPEQKRTSLWKSKRPGWEKLLDELFDERVLDAWNEGMVSAGSTDVGDVSWVAPAMEFSTTCCILGTPGHSWQFTAQAGMSIGHKSLIFASKVMAASALDLLTKPEILEKAREEWKTRLAGRVYKSPIPRDLKPPTHQFAR
jgi:aminobenzoyl-glutamate utilization protein B